MSIWRSTLLSIPFLHYLGYAPYICLSFVSFRCVAALMKGVPSKTGDNHSLRAPGPAFGFQKPMRVHPGTVVSAKVIM